MTAGSAGAGGLAGAGGGDQSAVIDFLADSATHGGVAVERVETHGAIVFLAGDRAYKLKRAVRYPYLDFSTLAKRRAACEAEIRINRRTAPELYLEAAPITQAGDGFAIGGRGTVVDWVVVMRRFDQETLFDRLAVRGTLDESLMLVLADVVAGFHRAAEPRRDAGAAAMAATLAGNAESLRATARTGEGEGEGWTAGEAVAFDQQSRVALQAVAGLLDARAASGYVRHCHGDLHLRNICLVDGRPTLFDAIEFDEALATIDVFYDLAFLLMDLDHRGMRGLANAVMNRYLARSDDYGALAALPFFLACRAAVRAHVTATAAGFAAADAAPPMAVEARGYFDLAQDYLAPAGPMLVAVGGLSGTGKSTLAHDLAPSLGRAPGAVVVRSDVVRKQLFGVDLFETLPQRAYERGVGARVYDRLHTLARDALAAGQAVIADAVYLREEERRAVAAVAADCGIPFVGLWLDAPAGVQEARIASRRGDASDATVAVLRQQLALDPGRVDWHRLEAGGAVRDVLARASIFVERATRPRG